MDITHFQFNFEKYCEHWICSKILSDIWEDLEKYQVDIWVWYFDLMKLTDPYTTMYM